MDPWAFFMFVIPVVIVVAILITPKAALVKLAWLFITLAAFAVALWGGVRRKK